MEGRGFDRAWWEENGEVVVLVNVTSFGISFNPLLLFGTILLITYLYLFYSHLQS